MSEEERRDDSRRREDAAIRLEQRFVDFIARYDKDKEDTAMWRSNFNDRLKPLEKMAETLTTPAKIIGGIILVMFTPALGIVGWNIGKWILENANRIFSGPRP